MYWQGWSEMGHISAEYVIQLISYYYIYGKLDHIYLEKQQDNSEKDNGSKHQKNTMSSGCFMGIWIFLCLLLYSRKLAPRLTFRWWIGEKGPVQQIGMQGPPCQVPSVTRHALSHWLWYDILVGQMECISSEHFSGGCLSRTRTMYYVILVQLMLISWKLYSLLSVW